MNSLIFHIPYEFKKKFEKRVQNLKRNNGINIFVFFHFIKESI